MEKKSKMPLYEILYKSSISVFFSALSSYLSSFIKGIIVYNMPFFYLNFSYGFILTSIVSIVLC